LHGLRISIRGHVGNGCFFTRRRQPASGHDLSNSLF
jgi:hypothetical protein